jgi:nitroreductase
VSIIAELKSRRAIRDYEPRQVEEEKIKLLLEAATWAPNDRMREPWTFYVIKGDSKKRYEELAASFLQERFPAKPKLIESSMKVLKSTPLHIIVTSDIVPGDPEATQDNEYAVCCAIHSMWLAATELGLGLVWRTRGVGLVRDERMFRFIGEPVNKKIVGNLFIGYPDQIALDKLKSPVRTPFESKTVWM